MSALQWTLVSPTLAADAPAGANTTSELAAATRNAELKRVVLHPDVIAALERVPGLLAGLVEPSPLGEDSTSLDQDAQELLLVAAIALQHAFVQPNWTGPDLDFTPAEVVSALGAEAADPELNAAALPLLTLLGEPAYHLAQTPALFLLSTRVLAFLARQDQPLLTLPWWQLRSHLVHLALLDEPVALDEHVVGAVMALAAQAPDVDTAASISLELGLLHHRLGQDRAANQAFLAAARSTGLEFELTGALGKRTKWQMNEVSQLVLLAESRPRDGQDKAPIKVPETLALNDDTLLEQTQFTKVTRTGEGHLGHLDPADQPALHPLDQALLLSLCLAQGNGSPQHGLTTEQMMPFISRVVSHPRNWSVHTVALLLRSRLEAHRSRTVERSTLQLAALIEQMPTADSTAAERLQFFHQLPLPSKWEMESELAKRYLTLGVIRSALDIFTRLEMWEEAVACLQRMEREAEAEKIVRDLLEGRKIESDVVVTLGRSSLSDTRRDKLTSARAAKLWCVLGDIALGSDDAQRDPDGVRANAIENYNKAWEVSGHSSSRAQRSIATLEVAAKNFEAAIPAFKAALAINPLFAHSWFVLGVCYMRLEQWSNARDAFKRCVAVNEDDSEGWNNLAAVYLRIHEEGVPKDEKPPAVSFENKVLAFRALKNALRMAYNNWRLWQNYMVVSIDVGELAEAVRAMTRVVEEMATNDPIVGVDPEVLDKLVDAVTRDDWNNGDGPADGKPPPTSNEGWGLYPLMERLFDVTILPRISDNARVWRTHARLLRWKEDWAGAVDDYLRAYRVTVAQDERVERDRTHFRSAVEEIEDLVATLSQLGPRIPKIEGKKGGDWRFQARGIVRTFMGRTREA
jgi:tetratricopeptide (TPR) repeat protein